MADDAQNNGPERPRVVGRPFERGRSGNPGGRPKAVVEVQELAKAHTADAIKALVTITTSSKAPPAARVAAAVALLDRGHGKPVQSHDLRHNFPAATAADAALLAIAFAGGSTAAETETGEGQPDGVVH